MSIRLGLLLGAFGTCAGCAMFQSPQVVPPEWSQLETLAASDGSGAGASGTRVLTEEERRALSRLPADMDEAILRTFREVRRFALLESAAGNVPPQLSNFLIGLTTFGAYKSIKQAGPGPIAGTAALGTAAYAAGTAVDWRERAAAYNRAGGKLLCLLDVAQPYVVFPTQASSARPASTGREQMLAMQATVRDKLAILDNLVARHGTLNQSYLVAPESVSKQRCEEHQWDTRSCKATAGSEGAQVLKICQQLQARRARLCSTRKLPAAYSTPATDVSAVFAAATSVRSEAAADLEKSVRIVTRSDRAGLELGRTTLEVMRRTAEDVLHTSLDPTEVLTRYKAGLQKLGIDLPTATPQSGPMSPAPPVQATRPRALDKATARTLETIESALEQLRSADGQLRTMLVANEDMPKSVDKKKFDACVSPEARLSLALVNASEPVASDASDQDIVTPGTDDLAALNLRSGASQAEFEGGLKICQRRLGMPETGKLTVAMRKVLQAGKCKAIQ